MQDGFYRPKYRDKAGKQRASRYLWARDPVDGRKVSTGCTTLEAAKAWRAARELIAANPAHAAAHEATLADWLDELKRAKAGKPVGTQRMYKTHSGHLARVFGDDATLAVICPAGVDRYLAQRRSEGASESTLGKEMTTIRQVAKLARRRGAWGGDVEALKPLDFSPEYVPRKRKASQAEMMLLRAHLPPARWAFVAFCVCTSARLIEARRFTKKDWDPRRKVVHLRGSKTRRADREVPIISLFEPWWTSVVEYAPFDWVDPSRDLPRVCRRLGIPPLTPNDLRRTCGSWMRAAGVRPADIARVMGHATPYLTERTYAQMDPEELAGLLESQLIPPKSAR